MPAKKSIEEVFDCIRKCTAESRNCEKREDGTEVCRPGYKHCVDNCRS